MAGSQEDVRYNPSTRSAPQQQSSSSEDEIDLADYLRVLWKRRYFILLGSVLPALAVGLILFLVPGNYSIAYIYDTDQNHELLADRLYSAAEVNGLVLDTQESEQDGYEYKVLNERFYSAENQNRLTARLSDGGSDEYSPELSKANIKLEVSNGLLTLTVIGRSQGEVQKICEVVRDNLEKVMPVYSVKDRLRSAIATLKNRMSDIERNRFHLELELAKRRAILAKLKNLSTAGSNSIPEHVVLHFNGARETVEYLPLAYQVQAADSNIINIEETININEAKYNYYETKLSLNERLATEIESQSSSNYTIEQYHSFLTALRSEYKDSELADYVSGYSKEIENLMSTSTPLVAGPGIHVIPRDNVKKATIVFVALLMITTFTSFLTESAQKSNTQAS